MQKTNNNPRRDFLKMIPVALASAATLSFFRFKKSNKYSEKSFKTISKAEADVVLKNETFSASIRLNPAPAPSAPINIKG